MVFELRAEKIRCGNDAAWSRDAERVSEDTEKSFERENTKQHTAAIWRPLAESSWFPKACAMMPSRVRPRHKSTPVSRYCAVAELAKHK